MNLTPRTVEPTKADVYRFEVQWDTPRRGANGPDVRAYVMIDEALHPLERMVGTKDRWEGNVPVPSDKPVVSYRYKFEYSYPTLMGRSPENEVSLPYFLDLQRGTPEASSPGR